MTTGSEIGAVNAGEFWYLLCPYEAAFGSQIGFAVVILGIIAVAIAIHNSSIQYRIWTLFSDFIHWNSSNFIDCNLYFASSDFTQLNIIG